MKWPRGADSTDLEELHLPVLCQRHPSDMLCHFLTIYYLPVGISVCHLLPVARNASEHNNLCRHTSERIRKHSL